MKFLALAAVAFASFSSLAVAGTISTPNDDGYIIYWGNGQTPSYGQSFTAPGGDLLSFTFTIQNDGGNSFDYQAYLYAWNGSTITGSALYTSPVETLSASANGPVTTSGINAPLVTGDEYIFFLSTLGDSGGGSAGFAASSSFAGGAFFFNNNGGSSPGTADAGGWNAWNPPDTAFTATFGSPTPEPSSLMLLGTGVMALFSQRKRFGIK